MSTISRTEKTILLPFWHGRDSPHRHKLRARTNEHATAKALRRRAATAEGFDAQEAGAPHPREAARTYAPVWLHCLGFAELAARVAHWHLTPPAAARRAGFIK